MKACKTCGRVMTDTEDCGGDCVCCMAAAGDPECVKACVILARDAVMWRQRYDEMVVTCAQTAKERDALLEGPETQRVVHRTYADALQEALDRRRAVFDKVLDQRNALYTAVKYALVNHNTDPDGSLAKLEEASNSRFN